ncbi:camelysin [Scopulibacillus darangshiensis]|uniref:Camelysin n=1 Tax=Scopulibacillus darangshiensis TaxID=442528 RepID=A0A4R2P8A0_9BACL|nr:TasA family protein [Scopulibacillus darangshiensis]TCP30241.1 camelysin [Scopulibacillus darangshiensis]
MGLKKKLGMGIASAALGLSLVGGGTYAYFSDQEVTNNTFAAGTLDLTTNPTKIINVDNIKPGDTMYREFKLKNNGSLDIGDITLNTDYTVTDAKGNNKDDFGKHIMVNFLVNDTNNQGIVYSATLAELKSKPLDVIQKNIIDGSGGKLKAGKMNKMYVEFEFVDNDKDQNEFQGDKVNLKWTFDATQTAGEER